MTAEASPEAGRSDIKGLSRVHIDLVYAAALRRTRGNAELSADVTQAVLLVTLQKAQAGKLPQEKHMAGWLIKVTGYAVLQANRAAARRARHEQTAGRTKLARPRPGASDDQIRSVIDEALLSLRTVDREVVVRRYLQGESVSDIGAALGMQQNAVSKRLARTIPKLRKILARRGVTAPSAAIVSFLVAEFAVKAPHASAMTLTAATVISELAKHVSWSIAMVKLKAAAIAVLALLILGAATTEMVIRKNQIASSQPTPLAWPPAPPTIVVARVIAGPTDAILQELLARLRESQPKVRVIHVQGTEGSRMYDSENKAWSDDNLCEGDAWLEAGPERRFRAEIAMDRSQALNDAGKLGPAKDSSYIETWDGTKTIREYRAPLSVPEGETFNSRYLKAWSLAGANFSMQLSWDEESASDAKGSRKTIDRNPLDPDVLAKMKLSARKVVLGDGKIAMELTVRIPDPAIARVETFWFDPDRGYGLLARRNTLSVQNQEVFRQTYAVEALNEAAPGIFYPGKAQMLWEQRGEPFVWESFAATRVTANEPVNPELFKHELSRGIKITDFQDGVGTKREGPTSGE